MRVGQNNEEHSPTMHLSQAISAYAPGKQVVKNEWIYQPAGILMKTKYDDNTTRYVLQNCTHCGYTVIRQGNVLNDCPKCGKENSMHGIKDMSISTEQRFTEVVEPVAFSVAFGSKPTRKMNAQGEMSFVQPVLLKMDPWQEKTSAAKWLCVALQTSPKYCFLIEEKAPMVLLFVLIAEEWSMSKVQITQKMFLLVISIYLLAFHVQEVKQW